MFSEIANLLCTVGCFAELEVMVYSNCVLSEVRLEVWLKALLRFKVLQKPLCMRVALSPCLRNIFDSKGRYFHQIQ